MDAGGNIYAAGSFLGNCDFDPGPGSDIHSSQNGKWDSFFSKFDSTGNFQWAKTWGGQYEDYADGCHVDRDGNPYVTGWFGYTCDFDTGPGTDIHDASIEGNDYLIKYDPAGNYLWGKAFGRGYTNQIRHNSSNDIFVAGLFGGPAQFDPTGQTALIAPNGMADGFLDIFHPDGTWSKVLTWDGTHAGDSQYPTEGVDIDANDNVYLVGNFTQTADLDPADGGHYHTSNGDADAFVTKLDPSLNYVWSTSWGSDGYEEGCGVAGDPLGRVYASGCFQNTCDFNPGPGVDNHTCVGVINSYLLRLNSDGLW
jgi:hypothetical protein